MMQSGRPKHLVRRLPTMPNCHSLLPRTAACRLCYRHGWCSNKAPLPLYRQPWECKPAHCEPVEPYERANGLSGHLQDHYENRIRFFKKYFLSDITQLQILDITSETNCRSSVHGELVEPYGRSTGLTHLPVCPMPFRLGLESQIRRYWFQRLDHKLYVLVQIYSHVLGTLNHIFPVDGACKCLVFHFPSHRAGIRLG